MTTNRQDVREVGATETGLRAQRVRVFTILPTVFVVIARTFNHLVPANHASVEASIHLGLRSAACGLLLALRREVQTILRPASTSRVASPNPPDDRPFLLPAHDDRPPTRD
jgi:hypothetical protein